MTDTPDSAAAALAVQLAALKGTLSQAREDLETAKRDLAARIDKVATGLAAQAERDPKGPPATCWPALDADAKTAAMAGGTTGCHFDSHLRFPHVVSPKRAP